MHRKKSIGLLAFLTTFLLLSPQARAYEVFHGPTEVTHWNKEKTDPGYILFQSFSTTYLINQAGQVINQWPLSAKAKLLPSGHILSTHTDNQTDTKTFVELDWEANKVWEHTEDRPNYNPHHDFIPIFNSALNQETLLYIANKTITAQQALAAGANPDKSPYQDVSLDAIVEVDRNGNVVWEWWFFDHLIQDKDPSKANYTGSGKTIADFPQKLNINLPGKPLEKDWLHSNSIDYHPELGHIVINSVHGEFYVINHDGTFIANDPAASIQLAASDKGDFLYRFGDPARYQQGEKPVVLADWNKISLGHKQLGASHAVSWIPPGFSSAGNFLIFNNGHHLYQPLMSSSIVEVNPYLNATAGQAGTYINPPEAGYRTQATNVGRRKGVNKLVSNQVIWQFIPESHQSFLSYAGSYAQRLKNGNTFVCANRENHLFEITREGQVVWEYITPLIKPDLAVTTIDASQPHNSVTRCGAKYSADYPGLQNQDLTPQQTLTQLYAQTNASSASGQTNTNPKVPLPVIIVTCLTLGLLLGITIAKKVIAST